MRRRHYSCPSHTQYDLLSSTPWLSTIWYDQISYSDGIECKFWMAPRFSLFEYPEHRTARINNHTQLLRRRSHQYIRVVLHLKSFALVTLLKFSIVTFVSPPTFKLRAGMNGNSEEFVVNIGGCRKRGWIVRFSNYEADRYGDRRCRG
jgi:hypothetical protein